MPDVPDVTEGGRTAGGPLPAMPVERERPGSSLEEDQILGGSSQVPGKWFISMVSNYH